MISLASFYKEVERFKKKEYDEARAKAAALAVGGATAIDKETFWKVIPGANFYIPAEQITNLNLRYPYINNKDLLNYLREALKDVAENATITVEDVDSTASSSELPPDERTEGHS